MKKLFTLAAAVLASVSLWAVEPTLETTEWTKDVVKFADVFKAYDNVTLETTLTGWSGNNGGFHYASINKDLDGSKSDLGIMLKISATANIDSVSIFWMPNGSDATNIAWATWANDVTPAADNLAEGYYGATAEYTASKDYSKSIWQTIDLTALNVNSVYLARKVQKFKIGGDATMTAVGKGKTFNIVGIRVWVKGIVPPPEPVASITINGDKACEVGQTITLTASAKKATEFWWTAKNSDVKLSETDKYDFTPTEAGDYTFVAYAQNEYNTEPVSAEWKVTVTEPEVIDTKDLLIGALAKDQTAIGIAAGAVETNLSKAKAVKLDKQKYFGLTLKDGYTFAEGDKVIINITTGADLGNYMLYADKEGNELIFDEGLTYTKSSAESPVVCPTGKKEITLPAAAEGKTALYLWRENGNTQWNVTFSSLTVYREGLPSAVDNIEAGAKAVKIVENGQLVIIKNGVRYNAQGTVVK